MFTSLWLRYKYGTYLRNEQGIRKFAEVSLGGLLRRVTRKSALYREQNESYLVEKANLRLRDTELSEQPRLEAGAFFGVRRRLWANQAIIIAAILASIILAFVSVTAFMNATDVLGGFVRWAIAGIFAAVLTGGGLLATERLIEALIVPEDASDTSLPEHKGGIATLWALVLVGVEFAIFGLAEVRAGQLAQQGGSDVLYVGFIAVAMVMPLIAGAVRWDAMRFVNVYKTTMTYRAVDSRLAEIDSQLRQNEEFESNFYKVRLLTHWDDLNVFRTYKENYNARKGIEENLNGHFAQTFDQFQGEATKRYESDLRDLTARSLRRLDATDGTTAVGQKLGQTPAPEPEPPAPMYLTPKPVH